ncbi:MAG: metallophosphoesterase family protein [Rhizobiaceae bacterium]|nr:metallophosphoesterase family protein [Rhizobiaceae bacterium]
MLLNEAQIKDGLRIYAIGDIHGCLAQLDELIEAIHRETELFPAREVKLIFLGDYVDRGPDNRGVIERLIQLKEDNPDYVFLLGNHDERMVKYIEQPDLVWDEFSRWGGTETLASYGVVAQPGESQDSISRRFAEAVPKAHVEFLKSLKFSHMEGDYFFCHAGVRPGIGLSEQSNHDLIWIRTDFLFYEGEFEKIVVHGHTPQSEPETKHNRINVDTHCYETGLLTALVLEEDKHRFLHSKNG